MCRASTSCFLCWETKTWMAGSMPGHDELFAVIASEAKQSRRLATKTSWIASSLPLLAMTTPLPLGSISPRLHRPVRITRLRHAAIERHVGMRAEPAIAIFCKHQRGAAGARKRRAVLVIAGRGPGRDHDRHVAVGRRENLRLFEHETEVGCLRPDIVPLSLVNGHLLVGGMRIGQREWTVREKGK